LSLLDKLEGNAEEIAQMTSDSIAIAGAAAAVAEVAHKTAAETDSEFVGAVATVVEVGAAVVANLFLPVAEIGELWTLMNSAQEGT